MLYTLFLFVCYGTIMKHSVTLFSFFALLTAAIIEVDLLKYFVRMFALKYLFDVVYLHVLEPRLLYLYTCMSHIGCVGPVILLIVIIVFFLPVCVSMLYFLSALLFNT